MTSTTTTSVVNFREAKSIFEFSITDPNDNQILLADQYKGNVCVIINISSKDKGALSVLKKLTVLNGKLKSKGLNP